jgi:hypothetical protein
VRGGGSQRFTTRCPGYRYTIGLATERHQQRSGTFVPLGGQYFHVGGLRNASSVSGMLAIRGQGKQGWELFRGPAN